jgi:hypothetical protein
MSTELEIQLDKASYAPGDGVRGWVRVQDPGRSRRLEVSLQYREKTNDYGGCVLQVGPVELNVGELQAGQAYEFNLQLPADAPPAYSTGVGQMWWAVMVHSDQVGPDKHFAQRVEVELPDAGG